MYAGRSLFSVPSPYDAQAPSDGQPKRTLPVFINVTAGSWLNVSEYSERTMANSSATPATCGNSSEISMPLWPCGRNIHGDPFTFGSLVLIIANS